MKLKVFYSVAQLLAPLVSPLVEQQHICVKTPVKYSLSLSLALCCLFVQLGCDATNSSSCTGLHHVVGSSPGVHSARMQLQKNLN